MRRLLQAGFWLCLFWWAAAHAQAPTHQVKTDQVQATLLVHAPVGLRRGGTFWLGLRLQHSSGWHTYWKNPGDSGLPTTLTWQLPPGLTARDVAWPTPQKFPLGDLANYGYGGDVLLPVEVQVSEAYQSGDTSILLDAQWLVCRTECIPEGGRFKLTIGPGDQLAEQGALFQNALSSAPKDASQSLKVVIQPGAGQMTVTATGWPPTWRGQQLEIFPEEPNLIAPGSPWTQSWSPEGIWTAQLPYSDQRSVEPTSSAVVFGLKEAAMDKGPSGLRTIAQVVGKWPDTTARVPVPSALAAALATPVPYPVNPATGSNTWLWALVGALLGGLILNLMPCVLPVLAIKVMAFAHHGGAARQNRIQGAAYTAGVLVSFLALGGGLLALRAAGEQLGWGFQLQSPAVVTALAVLFTLIGLNLAGLYGIGQMLPQRLLTLRAKQPATDAFLTGVLAAVVASPCTAPFMGASVGLAMGLPTHQALGVFGAVGFGMALPYLAASWIPALTKLVPRPGPWMETLKQWLAFPMLATVVWLVWVLGQQVGLDGAALLLLWLVGLGWWLWALGLSGRAKLAMLGLAGACLVWTAFTWGPEVVRHAELSAESSNTAVVEKPGDRWMAWSPEKQASALAKGQVVFVDYTAAWCVTCQYNKRTTLSNPDLLRDLANRDVALMRADWTRRDATVTAALKDLGRSGVPVYVFYKNGLAPVVLPEIPSIQDVRAALNQL